VRGPNIPEHEQFDDNVEKAAVEKKGGKGRTNARREICCVYGIKKEGDQAKNPLSSQMVAREGRACSEALKKEKRGPEQTKHESLTHWGNDAAPAKLLSPPSPRTAEVPYSACNGGGAKIRPKHSHRNPLRRTSPRPR